MPADLRRRRQRRIPALSFKVWEARSRLPKCSAKNSNCKSSAKNSNHVAAGSLGRGPRAVLLIKQDTDETGGVSELEEVRSASALPHGEMEKGWKNHPKTLVELRLACTHVVSSFLSFPRLFLGSRCSSPEPCTRPSPPGSSAHLR